MVRHIKTAAGILFAFILLFLIVGSRPAEAAASVKVTVPVLNVRLGPGTEYKKINSLKAGETYQVIDSQNGWYKLMIGTAQGWVCGDYVKTFDTETAPPPSVKITGPDGRTYVVDSITVNVNLLNVRSGNSVKSPIIGGIKKGDTYTVLDSSAGWFKIKYNYKQGWVCGDYVDVNCNEDEQDKGSQEQPPVTNIFDIQDIRFYTTKTGNFIAIPFGIKIHKGEEAGIPAPDIKSTKDSDGKISISIDCSAFSGKSNAIEPAENSLVSSVSITALEKDITVITICPKVSVDYDVYIETCKDYEDENYKYYRFYAVANLRGNGEITGTPQDDGKETEEKNNQGKTKGDYLVTLDAGHGGTTSGAVSGDYEEKMFNMDIITRVNNILKAQGYDTYLTRNDDTYVSLADRADAANILKSSIFISVHLNSYSLPSSNGTETLYNSQSQASGGTLAELIQKNLCMGLNRYNRGIKDRPDLYVLNSTNMPAALAEILFMSNSDELNVICSEDARQKAAESIARAVNEYFGFSN